MIDRAIIQTQVRIAGKEQAWETKEIQRVFRNHPGETNRGSRDLIDKTLLGKGGLHVSEAGFAHEPDFELLAVSPRESSRPEPATGDSFQTRQSDTGGRFEQRESLRRRLAWDGRRSSHRTIAIAPAVQIIEGVDIAPEEGAMRVTSTLLRHPSETVFDSKETERLRSQS